MLGVALGRAANDDVAHPEGRGIRTGSLTGRAATHATPEYCQGKKLSGKKLFPPLRISSVTEKNDRQVFGALTPFLALLAVRDKYFFSARLESALLLLARFLKLSLLFESGGSFRTYF